MPLSKASKAGAAAPGGGVFTTGVEVPPPGDAFRGSGYFSHCVLRSFLLCISGKQKDFTVGRFQVTPFKAPPTDHSQPRPPPSSQSESSERSRAEQSQTGSSITSVPSPGNLLGYHDNHRVEQQDRREDETEEGVMERWGGQRLCEGSADGSATNNQFNQWWNRSAPSARSDDSDSDRQEMWAELQELRER